MSTRRKPKTSLSRAEREKLRQDLLELKKQAKNNSIRRMIELSIKGLDEGVERMTPEEIYESLGRGHG